MRRFFLASAAALSLGSALAACGGGGGGPSPLPISSATPAATTTPTASPTATPTPSSQTGTVPVSAAATTAPIPPVAGFSGSVSLPNSNASGSTTITATSTTSAPAGAPPLDSRRRFTATSSPTVYLYESFTPSATITFNGAPGFTLALPPSISAAGQQFYVALLAPGSTQWQMAVEGPAQVSGQTLTFAQQTGISVTMNAGQTYWFAFYSVAETTPTPAPTATPTAAPTATPTPAASKISLSPPSLSVQTYQSATFTASETGYTGAFMAQVSTGNCYVWATNSTNSTGGTSASAADGDFSLVAADTGGCTVSVSDANNNVAALPVSVVVPPFGVQPASLSLSGTGASNTQAFSIIGGSGPYTVGGYDDTVISVSVDASSSTVYDVTPLKAGQTTITVKDSTGASSTIAVTVTTVSGVIQ